ncbi:MAG: methylmalonyl-CoA mutase family protein [Proteobacteria bacterium]|nr:methylmalonyl-CoA mutase family protein [Pseudomonadota bacterium]MBU1586028.1 methylmalonyl-CoA mutase family protein [Pseudomonadota bacterium]MBU2455108.1 methylmalonyl-CoA mutase family protein [Pseudomonadota bacterium]MBU2628513.1 methylmalonyl-CoA mutase family protein [Pseudomonadota bacterium]
MSMEIQSYKPKHSVKVVTATSLFDGHDASINIMRRILQDSGAEVIHIGHNRSAKEVVDAAIEEDAQGIAVSSYQGGHVEYFKYMVDLLKQRGASHIKIFGGGGGVIIPAEMDDLHAYGVTRIYSPEDGSKMGLQGMINDMMRSMDVPSVDYENLKFEDLTIENKYVTANFISAVQEAKANDREVFEKIMAPVLKAAGKRDVPVIGLTGTGGAGKSSLTDELIIRILRDLKEVNIAIISCDPSRRKTGGALLGDRIRMNSIETGRVYMRSLATRRSQTELPDVLPDAISVARAAGYDLVIVETAGIGQGDSRVVDLVDMSIYVMTAEFGAPSQLEKIDMLDYADIVVVNKYEKKGSEDALRDVRKQVQRNRKAWDTDPKDLPVFGTIASKFNDDGTTALYHGLLDLIAQKKQIQYKSSIPRSDTKESTSKTIIIPGERTRYLAEIADTVRDYHKTTQDQARAVRSRWHLIEASKTMEEMGLDQLPETLEKFKQAVAGAQAFVQEETDAVINEFTSCKGRYEKDELIYHVRNKEFKESLFRTSLSHSRIPKISLPQFQDPGEQYTWMRKENFAGNFPYTAGVFPLKRADEDPTRMFAGEGGPEDTNRRFKLLSGSYPAKRLSTAFDSVTLYGFDPDTRPDIYGKIGTSGVSICTLDDVKVLYGGFNLCAPNTSVSMTINGPAPMMLAMFMNTAIAQQMDRFKEENNREPSEDEAAQIRRFALSNVRGTVQADILKEDQGQNTCIFSIEFALKMMGDIQQYFIDNQVKNFYSVSISGYHIAEAGANPITQLALTLANGFTYVEYYLSRGMDINSFAPSLSFFFSNGMDPEYTVIGRVARRIWAVAMKYKYGGNEKSQKLKYHIQTSGRSLHSQDIQFNDIRTTLQGLCAIYDNCNSLHTNAFDEAITTPSAESVRRALAIQLIVNREWGLAMNENPLQGSFIVDELTDLVEEAVLIEFEKITERGGVLGAMETGYQRGKIQEESMYYEHLKHSGKLPLIGVNTFEDPDANYAEMANHLELSRATDEQKNAQLQRLAAFKEQHQDASVLALEDLKQTALSGENMFERLMDAVKVCSLGTITQSLYEVGGKYRRNM